MEFKKLKKDVEEPLREESELRRRLPAEQENHLKSLPARFQMAIGGSRPWLIDPDEYQWLSESELRQLESCRLRAK